MNFDQALAVMDARLGPNPPAYGEWFVAGQVIADHYARHPEKLRAVYFTDARSSPMLDLPGRTFDQPRYTAPEKSRALLAEEFRPFEIDASWANIQRRDGPTQSADLVQTLEGDASSYLVSVDLRTGKAGLFRYRQPQIDPGLVGRSSGGTARTMDRGPDYYRSVAKRVSVQRELTGVQLRSINEANRKAWQGK